MAGPDRPLPDWRRAGGVPAATGDLRATPADFRVIEVLDVDFSGDGEHDWLWLEKTGTNTDWLARQLAGFAGVPARDVGYAGRKDRHAMTRQWFSVRRAAGRDHDWSTFRRPGVTLIDTVRHRRKLKTGAHQGNRFELLARRLDGDPRGALQRIATGGVPNYFGEQRFGRAGGNVRLAESLFGGTRLRRGQRSMALSAARALLFNAVLDSRVTDGTWNRLLSGDVAILDGSNSFFTVDVVDAELERRCAALDLHPSGPLWGRGSGEHVGHAVERDAATDHAALAAGLERHCDAARRALRVRPANFEWQIDGDSLTLKFTLPRGAYATTVLREVLYYRDASGG